VRAQSRVIGLSQSSNGRLSPMATNTRIGSPRRVPCPLPFPRSLPSPSAMVMADSRPGPSSHDASASHPNDQSLSSRPRSPPSLRTTADSADSRPHKRARKAINCEPCRNSKLKCDRFVYSVLHSPKLTFVLRNRPCSSCVLRGKFRSFFFRLSVTPVPRNQCTVLCRRQES
jgi:hypothetical protein